MNYKLISLFLSLLLLAGCASEPRAVAPSAAQKVAAAAESAGAGKTEVQVVADNVETSADDNDRVICRTITPTGSHRKKTICRSVGEIKQQRQAAQDAVRRGQGGPTGAPADL